MSRPHHLLMPLAAAKEPPPKTTITEQVVASAVEHRMHGLLWEWVEAGVVSITPRARDVLATRVLASRSRSRRLSAAASEICGLLATHEIYVAVFKGVAAERRWYPGPGSRPATDIDLWLAPHQLHRAREVVGALEPDHPLVDHVAELATEARMRSVELEWGDIPVDLHFDPFKFGVWYEDLDAVWADTENVGDDILAMGSAAELITSLLHLNKDRFSRLLGFVDVVRAADDPTIAAAAWQLTSRIGASVPVASAASVVGATLGVNIPLPSPRPGWRATLWERLWPEETRLLGNEGYASMRRRQDLLPFLCDGRFLEALGFLRHMWFPPKVLLEYFNPHVTGLPYPLALWKSRTTRDR